MKVNAGQASSTLIPEYIGSDFDKVITVADNIETVTEVVDNLTHIKTVESNLENIVTVADNVTDVGNVSANIGYVKSVAEGIEGLPVISYIGEQPPTQPLNGSEWYCTTDGRSYVWYEDNDSCQWVESSPQSDSNKGQHYFGNWNPNEQKYPVSEYYSGLWDVVLNPGQSSVQFDNKTWVTGNKLSYYSDTGIYTQIQTLSEVVSVNGYKGAVVLSAADISADASGAAESAVSVHEVKAGVHNINGVLGLQDALDGKYSPDNKPTAVDIGALASNGTAVAATKLATPRTLTIGNTGKVFDGTENVNWSAAEIGGVLAAACVPTSTNVPDVGSIALVTRTIAAYTTAPTLNYGATMAGSSLTVSSVSGGIATQSCTGTWKALSFFSSVNNNNSAVTQLGLAIRIA